YSPLSLDHRRVMEEEIAVSMSCSQRPYHWNYFRGRAGATARKELINPNSRTRKLRPLNGRSSFVGANMLNATTRWHASMVVSGATHRLVDERNWLVNQHLIQQVLNLNHALDGNRDARHDDGVVILNLSALNCLCNVGTDIGEG